MRGFNDLRLSHGGSPGNGITEPLLSREPLATEGEATPGPDTENPYRDALLDAERGATESTPPAQSSEEPPVFDGVIGGPDLPRFF